MAAARCSSVASGKRCQLLAPHAEPHAHLWSDPPDRYAMQRARWAAPRTHVLRWREGEQWYDAGDDYGNPVSAGRLRWAAMGSS